MATATELHAAGLPVGRQPDIKLVTPSSVNPWYGTIVEGRPFTKEQEAQLISRGIGPVGCEAIEVRRNATDREFYWGIGQRPPFFAFQCPVIGRMADGRIKVISPSGFPKIVLRDGWVTRPGKPKGHHFG